MIITIEGPTVFLYNEDNSGLMPVPRLDPRLAALPLPKPGTYLVAVSGGVDSVVLLDWLASTDRTLVVAHFDHCLRPNSAADAQFVQRLAKGYNLDCIVGVNQSPAGSDEAAARQARYRFLAATRQSVGAGAVVTAHHQDDLLETIILNLGRGTGRRGLTSLRSHDQLWRPFLGLAKAELVAVAEARQLEWVEDATNLSPQPRRNWVRQTITPQLDQPTRQQLVEIYQRMCQLNDQFDQQLANYLKYASYRRQGTVYARHWFNCLPDELATEVVHWWLASRVGVWGRGRQINYLVRQLRQLPAGKQLSLTTDCFVALTKRSIRFNWPVLTAGPRPADLVTAEMVM